jgi:phosphopantothenate synthetase
VNSEFCGGQVAGSMYPISDAGAATKAISAIIAKLLFFIMPPISSNTRLSGFVPKNFVSRAKN